MGVVAAVDKGLQISTGKLAGWNQHPGSRRKRSTFTIAADHVKVQNPAHADDPGKDIDIRTQTSFILCISHHR
jgi:hypothetical protein